VQNNYVEKMCALENVLGAWAHQSHKSQVINCRSRIEKKLIIICLWFAMQVINQWSITMAHLQAAAINLGGNQ
jgi:hypothetical protein